jgi:hypothetical protein
VPSHSQNEKEPKPTMSQSFFRACVLILFGVVAIAIAIDFIARFWGRGGRRGVLRSCVPAVSTRSLVARHVPDMLRNCQHQLTNASKRRITSSPLLSGITQSRMRRKEVTDGTNV